MALLSVLGVAPARATCPDCDGDGQVSIGELVTGVSIALGAADISACVAMDGSGDGVVSIDELITAISSALDGCQSAATPTPTATSPSEAATPTPTATPTAGAVPTQPAALLAWLQAGNYLAWMRESAPHQSAGPHGGIVRTYVNDPLFASLTDDRSAHPAGAVAVKELYFRGSTVTGWAVMVKLEDDSDGGRGWYWYEYFGSGTPYSGIGLGVCTGCHSLGRDYVRISFPLQ